MKQKQSKSFSLHPNVAKAHFLFCTLFILVGIPQLGYAQEKKINISEDKIFTVDQVFELINKQTDYRFIYKADFFKNSPRIQLKKGSFSLDDLLKKTLSPQKFTFSIEGKVIKITKKDEADLEKNKVDDKRVDIKGKIIDEGGEALIGVYITEKGSTNGVVTDIDGNYSIKNVLGNGVLEVTYIGMKEQQIPVDYRTRINLTMQEDSEILDEVVVVGFGQQKKKSVVVSISSVKPSEISVPTRNLTNSLAGQVSGLIAVQRNGEPGYDNAEFWIRGVSTYAGGTNPLVLVDGVPRSMNDIEPDEIETFSVLKDAAATAVYGAQGANGVVLITTKRGKAEKAKITFRTEHSISTPTRLPKFVGSARYMELFNEAKRNDGEAPQFSEELINKYRNNIDPDLFPNTNWLDLMLRDYTSNHRFTLNARGGTEKARYFVSGAYYNESGLFAKNATDKYDTSIGLNRFNLRSNIDMDLSKSTTLSVDVSGQYLINTYPGTGTSSIFRAMLITPPYVFPAEYSDGTIATYPQERDSNMRNPWNLLMHSGYAKEWRTSFQSRIGIDQKLDFITEGLRTRGSISFDYDGKTYWRRTFNPTRYHATGRNKEGILSFDKVVSGNPDLSDPKTSTKSTKRIYAEVSLGYNRTFQKHTVGGMLLYNQREAQASGDALPYRKQGLVGRATYAYDDRYFIEANFGYTGSETFAEGYRFGLFPALGLAYYISNEKFYPKSLAKYINKVKMRFSIGKSGNDNTGGDRFLYRPTFKTNAGGFNQGIGENGGLNGIGNGIFESRFAAPNLSWEIENKVNYGIELGFFNNRIDLIVDYFNNERTGILLQRKTVPQVSGFRTDPWQNFGVVSNKGVDASLDIKNNFGDLIVGIRSTFTFARNKILEYDELTTKYPWMSYTGKRVSENQVYIAERLYTEDDFNRSKNPNGTYSYTLKNHLPQPTLGGLIGPGDIKYKDVNGDGVIDNYDIVRGVGNPETPEIVYGFGVNLEYKGFYFNAFFQGVGNTTVRLGGRTSEGWYPFAWGVDQSNYRTFATDRWTSENPNQNALMPRLHISNQNNANNTVASTWWLRDGAFLRFKNLEVGYNFPKEWLRKISVENARLYFSGYNLAVWDDIDFFDPEVGNGNAGLNYPLSRTFSMGLEFTF